MSAGVCVHCGEGGLMPLLGSAAQCVECGRTSEWHWDSGKFEPHTVTASQGEDA